MFDSRRLFAANTHPQSKSLNLKEMHHLRNVKNQENQKHREIIKKSSFNERRKKAEKF